MSNILFKLYSYLIIFDVFSLISFSQIDFSGLVLGWGLHSTVSEPLRADSPKDCILKVGPSEHDHEVNHPLPINKLIAASETRKMHYL